MKNLRPKFFEKLEFLGVGSFEQMDRICMAVEDHIRNGKLKKEATGFRPRRPTYSSTTQPDMNMLAPSPFNQYQNQ